MFTSLEEIRQYIDNIDFSRIINKLVNYNGWLSEDALLTCKQYRNFLFLNRKYHANEALPPSEDIDEFWHAHILDTEAYAKDCQAIFGKFMHHYPYFGIDGRSDMHTANRAFETTKELYFKEFGEKIVPTRSQYPKFLYGLMKKMQRFN